MLNNWDDPFAQFSKNNNATSDIGNAVNDAIKAEAIEAEEAEAIKKAIPVATAEASSITEKPAATTVTSVSATQAAKAPHAGDGIVSNEQLMATAGAAPLGAGHLRLEVVVLVDRLGDTGDVGERRDE